MKLWVILFFLLILGIDASADGKKSFFALNASYSIPLGNYAAKNLEYGCFTISGASFGAEGAWFATKHFGLGLDVNYSLHSVDVEALAQEKLQNEPSMSEMLVTSNPYTMLTTTGGIYFTTNITERISVQSKALIGMSYGKTPFQLYQPTIFMIGPTYYKVTSAGDYGTAYKTGLSFQYQFNSNVAMGINANYTYTKFSFGFYGAQGQINYYQKRVSYLDLGLGLVVKL